MRLLIVEDEVDVALTIEDVALGLGFEVVGIATNMQEALEIAPETEIALVDLRLADGITGPAIARALVAGWNIGVVFVTGSPELNEEVDGLLTIEAGHSGRCQSRASGSGEVETISRPRLTRGGRRKEVAFPELWR